MTRATLSQSVVPVLLFTVHGHVCPIDRVGAVVRAPMAPRLARGLHVSLGQDRSTPRGSGAPVLTLSGSDEAEIVPDRAQGSSTLMTSWGLGRGKNCRPRRLSRPRPLREARTGWRLAFGPRAIDMLSAPLAGRFYRAPTTGL
jgi:hypothetical protein